MGDMADWTIDNGIMTDLEEEGWWDEDHDTRSSPTKTCRACGKGGLTWGEFNGKWRLIEGDKVHDCPVKPVPEAGKRKPGRKPNPVVHEPEPEPEPEPINDYMYWLYSQLRIFVKALREHMRSGKPISEHEANMYAKILSEFGNDIVRGQAIEHERIRNEKTQQKRPGNPHGNPQVGARRGNRRS